MPVYTRELLDITGCDVPDLGFSGLEKSILKLVGSTAETFTNPIEQGMNQVRGAIETTLNSINVNTGVTMPGADPLTTYGYLAVQLENLNAGVAAYRIHSDRLSGLSVKKAFGPNSPYGPGGIQGEYPGIAGLHSIASQYNTLRESLRDPEQAAKDYYSPIFNSLFGPGDDLMRSMTSLVEGDVGNFLTNFPQGGVNSIPELTRLGRAIQDLEQGVYNLIQDDNLQYEFALDFVLRHTLGFSVLSMLDEPCFGTRLLEKIAGPALAGLAFTPQATTDST